MRFSRLHAAACAASLLVAACAAVPPGIDVPGGLGARVDAIFARRGLGPDALSVIDNILRHEAAAPPPFAPPIVRELLARPLAAANAAALFDRAVPTELRRLADEVSAPTAAGEVAVSLTELLNAYVAELAEAQLVLRAAAKDARIDGPAVVRQLDHELPTAAGLRGIAAADAAEIDRATALFVGATGRFIRSLRAAGTTLRFPEAGMRLDSPIGAMVIGTMGDDVHGPDAALIIDPGGNDIYERAPATGGAVSVIVDLGGDDHYRGSDLVVHGLSAIIDFSGDDRYAMTGPGLGAAIAGTSLIVDFTGDDLYEAGLTSLSTVNLMLALEEHFNVEFLDRMLGRKTFGSIRALNDAIAELRGAAASPAMTAPLQARGAA